MSLLSIEDLTIEFETRRGQIRPVDRISFEVSEGETLGIVGESGCGKSITSLALMGLLPSNGSMVAQKAQFMGKDLLTMPESERRNIRGAQMSMIFQDPMTSLNPSFTVGFQVMEVLKVHRGGTKDELYKQALELLNQVGIPAAETRMHAYPHQLSGGMNQRIMIAISVACRPKLLIADEPTTALDVTIQAQILELLKTLQQSYKMSLILITHDLGVVSQVADRIAVMYAGQIVEMGKTDDVISRPAHPYTQGLLKSLPSEQKLGAHRARLQSIPGLVPDLLHRPTGCQFHPRCRYATDQCRAQAPALFDVRTQLASCFFPLGTDKSRESQVSSSASSSGASL